MSVAAFIVVALAVALNDMLLLRHCAEPFPVRLSAGLVIAFALATVHTVLFLGGIALGDLLRIESPSDTTLYNRPNSYIMLGLFLIVILKMIFPYLRRNPQLPIFNITDNKSIAAMSVASGVNILLIGIGVGFTTPLIGHIHLALWPMLTLAFLFGYLGIMFGRQKVVMRPLRWMIVICILLLGIAIASVVNA